MYSLVPISKIYMKCTVGLYRIIAASDEMLAELDRVKPHLYNENGLADGSII